MFSRYNIMYSDSASYNLYNFKPLRTICFSYIHLFTIFSVAIITASTMIYYSDHQTFNSQNYLMCQAALWLLSFVLYLKYASKHHFLKLGGHFIFYKKMQKVALALFIVPSFFSSLILCVMGMFIEMNQLNTHGGNYMLSLHYLMSFGILIELFVEMSILLVYIVSVNKFNQVKPVPDVEQYEYLLPCDARSSSEIGYRLEGEAVADLLEKQADLICYFKSTIIDLKSKLSELSVSCH